MKCSCKFGCTDERWGIGWPHWNCIFTGFCAYQFYIAERKVEETAKGRGDRKMKIYIAGPYCPQNCTLHQAAKIAQQNVDKAIEVANRLIEKGHFVFVPHLSHYIHTHSSCHKDYGEWWYEEDNTFLEHWATAFFYIKSSKGADAELALARKLGLPIFYSLEAIPKEVGKPEEEASS
jgi:hypothetical protein